TVGAGSSFWLGEGAAARVHAGGPGLVDERSGDQMLAVGAVEHKEKRIAAGLGKQLARLALELSVKQNRRFDGVPVVHVVGRGLKVPDQLPSVGIESHDGAGIKIVAFPALTDEHGIGIAGAPVKKIEL